MDIRPTTISGNEGKSHKKITNFKSTNMCHCKDNYLIEVTGTKRLLSTYVRFDHFLRQNLVIERLRRNK